MDVEVSGDPPAGDPQAGDPQADPQAATPLARERRSRRRAAGAAVLAAALGIATGFAVATVRDDRKLAQDAVAGASPSVPPPEPDPVVAQAPGLPPALAARMVDQVRRYNQPEPATSETSDVVLMTLLHHNLTRLDTARSYPPGEYRLQVICLGQGEVWALFRIGDDEAYVDLDCHGEYVLVSQLPLTARATGQRAVTLVSDSAAGIAVGYQILTRT